MQILIVGAGLSGAVIAHLLAEAGHDVTVLDERAHVAGNCHTERDPATGVMVHVHGPHIFHTDDSEVWDFICRFGRMMPYHHRVRARVGGQVYSLPINLLTINQVFGTAFSPAEARQFLEAQAVAATEGPQNFETRALSLMGERLYRALFAGYTQKQWGVAPCRLPAWLLSRLPMRFNYDDTYFHHSRQAIPEEGYTQLVACMLDHPKIALQLGTIFTGDTPASGHLVYSGKLDRYYDERFGPLGYRTLDFERIDHDGDFQGVPVMNYCDADVPFTRISEHRHFAPWEGQGSGRGVAFREYSRACGPDDIPYYPLGLAEDQDRLRLYVEHARQDRNVTFVGRLGTYSYLDMDVAIRRGMQTARALIAAWEAGQPAPVFVHDPLEVRGKT